MILRKTGLLLLAILGTPVFGTLIDTPWEKTGEGNGIFTYQRASNTGLLHVKGIAIIDQGIDKMGNLFRDIPGHVKWVGYCNEARVLKVINRNQYIFYETMEPPWPVTKRDMVLESKSWYSKKNLSVKIESQAIKYNQFPPPEDTIRIERLNVKLEMEYITRQKTGLIYEVQIDPDAGIPDFISNMFNQFYVYQNLTNLQLTAADSVYMKSLSDTTDTELIEKLIRNQKILRNSLKTRLSRLILSKANLDLLINDSQFMDSWVSNQSGFAEKLFLAAHDRMLANEALKKIIQVYLKRFPLSEYEKYLLINNSKVHKIFISDNIEKSFSLNDIHNILNNKT